MDDTHQSLVEETVCEFIRTNPSAKSSQVDLASNLAELNIDSLEKLSIGMDLEDKFEIEFSDEEIEAFIRFLILLMLSTWQLLQKPYRLRPHRPNQGSILLQGRLL